MEGHFRPGLATGRSMTPYQRPDPPLAVSAMSPASPTARLAGERGWGLVSANFMPVGHAKTHWQQYRAGAEAAGRRADREQWRLARTILVTETDDEARDYLADESCSIGWYYTYLRDNLATYKLLKIFKPSEAIPDEDVTFPKCVEWMGIHGGPKRGLDQLVALVDGGGTFRTVLRTNKSWARP